MGLVVGEAEEGGAGVGVVGSGSGEHEPGELGREMGWGFGSGGAPVGADGSESDEIVEEIDFGGDEVD